MTLTEMINALAFKDTVDEEGQPIAIEELSAERLRDAQAEAVRVLTELDEARDALGEMTEKVDTLLSANQQLKLENINLTAVATGDDKDDDVMDGIIVG